MKVRKFIELYELKEKIKTERLTYRSLVNRTSMSLTALNDKINGFSEFTMSEIMELVIVLEIESKSIEIYFFPERLRNAILNSTYETQLKTQ